MVFQRAMIKLTKMSESKVIADIMWVGISAKEPFPENSPNSPITLKVHQGRRQGGQGVRPDPLPSFFRVKFAQLCPNYALKLAYICPNLLKFAQICPIYMIIII